MSSDSSRHNDSRHNDSRNISGTISGDTIDVVAAVS
jgi:hypothetical protein